MNTKTSNLRCHECGSTHTVGTTVEAVRRWQALPWAERPLIQHQFPWLNADDREMILTGTCPACWERLFDEADPDQLQRFLNRSAKPITLNEVH